MKADSNMETDRLLRSYARGRQGVPNSFPDGAEAHLDADELIAYAENALPVATRARYTHHLSECDSCRKSVAQLAISSGVPAQLEVSAKPAMLAPVVGWRERLGALFAPRVLRYAASVILLIGISAIGVMVFRGGRDMKFTTPSSEPNRDSGGANAPAPAQQANRGTGDTTSNAVAPTSTPRSQTTTEGNADQTDAKRDLAQTEPGAVAKSGEERGLVAPAAPGDTLAGVRRDGRDEDTEVTTKQQPSVTAVSSEQQKAKKEVDIADSTNARESAGRADQQVASQTQGAKMAESKAPPRTASKPAANSRARMNPPPPPKDSPTGEAMDDRAAGVGSSDKSSSTRVVNGRRFNLVNGAWVDTAYRSQATTNVKRGSDQYRALIGDEPGLRTIANSFSGVVITVWKGRAYRFY